MYKSPPLISVRRQINLLLPLQSILLKIHFNIIHNSVVSALHLSMASIHSFIHSVVGLATGPQPHPKRVLYSVRSSVSSLSFQYLLFPLRSSSSSLGLFPLLPVTSVLPSIFPSITCFRRQSLRKM